MMPRWLAMLAMSQGVRARPVAGSTVGFTRLSVPQPDDPTAPPLDVGLWYPAISTAEPETLGPMRQVVAADAPPQAGRHGLVLISHGNGGWFGSHIDTALALAAAGFVVAAPTHAGDDFRDQSRSTDPGMRARQGRAVIDAVLSRWGGRDTIDPAAIGVFGFSAGGVTALLLAGAVPDLSRVKGFCAAHTKDYGCRLRAAHPPPARLRLDGLADGRVRAIAIASPALAYTVTPAALNSVAVPVSLWQAGADSILPHFDGADPLLRALRRDGIATEPHLVAGADHWDFLAPCTDALVKLAPQICTEQGGFDREAFHRTFNAALIAFFHRTLIRRP